MADGVRVALGFLLAVGLAVPLTELARRLAVRTDFYDRPTSYKAHAQPTPYLGGLAVVAAALIGAGAPAGAWDDFSVLAACSVALLALGTLDDRIGLDVTVRLSVQIAAAIVLWNVGAGWELASADVVNLALTIVWVVGIVNAFNLMDNEDGAAATVAACCGAGVAALALIQGAPELAAIAAALAGACVGFLPFNLARPARIFLGDGGSMPIGLILAAAVMSIPNGTLEWGMLLATAPLVGLPILDTTLVVVSRRRRQVPVLSGARDHITHRLLAILGTPRRVAATLAVAQLGLCGMAIALVQLNIEQVVVAAALYLAVGFGAVAWLDTRLVPRPQPAPRGL